MEAIVAIPIRALILDLRNNPGGLLTAAIEVSDMFVDRGMIVSAVGRNVPKKEWEATVPESYTDFPMVVLVNRLSASGSEIVAACLQDNKRATIVGQRTWGKGSVQRLVMLQDGKSALKLTTSTYQRPSGKNIHRSPGLQESDEWGVRPDPDMDVRLSRQQALRVLNYQRDAFAIRSDDAMKNDPPAFVLDDQVKLALENLRNQIN